MSRLIVEMNIKDNISSGMAKPSKAVRDFQNDIKRVDQEVSKTRKFSLDTSALDNFAQNTGLIGAALTGIAAGGALAFGSFEAQINALGASTGATSDQLSDLSELALQIGADTSFGASEAAGALTELARAGVDLQSILDGTGRAAVDLAAATGTQLATSANILANTLATFSSTGLESADAIDILTAAANASSAELPDLAAGLRVLGPVATNLGLDLQDAAAAIAYFTKFGIPAADVGVSLARGIDQAATASGEAAQLMKELGIEVFDAQKKFVGFPALFDNLKRSLGGLSDEQRTAALAMIFGAEAADVLNIAVREGAAGYNELHDAIAPAGQAAAASEARMKGLNGAIEQMKGSVETAAIAFGSNLAPAIEFGAGLVDQLANAFVSLPGPVQQVAAGMTGLVGVTALLAAGLAKGISLGIETAASFSKMAGVIRGSATAMSLLGAAFSPVGLAVAGVAIALGILIHRHQEAKAKAKEHEDAINALKASLQSFDQFVTSLRFDGLEEAAVAAELFRVEVDAAVQSLEIAANTQFADSDTQGLKEMLTAYNALTSAELQARADAVRMKFEAMDQALRHPGVNVAQLAGVFNDLIQQLTRGDITIDQFNAQVDDNVKHLERYKLEVGEAGDATGQLTDAQLEAVQAAEEAAKAQEEFNKQLDAVIQSSLLAISGLEDIAPTLDGLQTGFTKAGASASEMVKMLDKVGVINLDPAEKQALKLARQLERVKAAIERTQAAIDQNAGDMQMWAGRISLVDDTLGTVEDGYKALNSLVESGRLTQAEANKILDDAIWLRERSVGGIEDERAEQARQISTLAEYVRMHDEANGAVAVLTETQKGFLAALESSQGQTALQTVQLIAYLAMLGLIPPEKVTQVITDLSASDPVVAGLFADLDLLGQGTDIPISVSMTGDGTDVMSGDLTAFADSLAVAITPVVEAPDTTALDSYEPPTIRVPVILKAPLTDLLDSYKPEPIHVSVLMDTPSFPEGMQWSGPDGITVGVDADISGFNEGMQSATESLRGLTTAEWNVMINGTPNNGDAGLSNGVAVATNKLNTLITADWTVLLNADSTSADAVLGDLNTRLDTFASSTYTTTLNAFDNASWVIGSIHNAINNLPSSKTITINTVNTTTTAARAGGGYVREALTMVGEMGPELVSLPYGSYVHTASQTKKILTPTAAATVMSGGGGAGTVVQETHYHIEGNVYGEEDFIRRVTKAQVDAKVEAKKQYAQGQGV